jgi:hypothetical protein
MTRKRTIHEILANLVRSGKVIFIIAASVEANWDESMHIKEHTRTGQGRFSITYDLHGASENGHFY